MRFIAPLFLMSVVIAAGGCASIAGIQDLPSAGGSGSAPGAGPNNDPAATFDAGVLGDGGAASPPTAVSPTGTAPSCANVPPTCGADGASDCCASLPLPGGSYYRDYDAKDFTDSTFRATVSPFRLDRFEVTLGRFRGFVAAYTAGWRPAVGSGANPASQGDDGWSQWAGQNLPQDGMALEANLECHTEFQTYARTPTSDENRPINCVTWYVAFSFCVWDGGRLPTDAEMNYAAAGGDDQRYYPWNDSIDEDHSSYFVDSTHQCRGDKVDGCVLADLTPVGTHAPGAGKWGHDDLAGNVAEWVRDGDSSTAATCNDCIDPADRGGVRRVRGGAFNSAANAQVRVAAHETADPTAPSERIGIRCARAP